MHNRANETPLHYLAARWRVDDDPALAGLALFGAAGTGLALSGGRLARQTGLAMTLLSAAALAHGAKELERKLHNSVRLLMRAGADATARNDQGQTPVMLATRLEYPDTAKAMEAHMPAQLHEAARTGNAEAAVNLMNAGVDPNIRSAGGLTLLYAAAQSGHANVIAVLTAAGADPGARHHGETPLHVAARHADIAAMRALLAAGADPNADDSHGETPLHEAAKAEPANAGRRPEAVARCVEGIILLLGAGSRAGETDLGGYTPLHVTTLDGFPETVDALVAGGAPLNTPNNEGETALHLAIGSVQWDNAIALIHLGADPHVKTPDGRTALDYALGTPMHGFSDAAAKARARVVAALRSAME